MKVRKNVNRFWAFLLALVLMFTTFTSDVMTVNATELGTLSLNASDGDAQAGNTYTIKYEKNAAFITEGTVDDQTAYVGVPTTLASAGFKNSYSMLQTGWKDSNNNFYKFGSEYTNKKGGDVVLKAEWADIQSWHIIYHLERGSQVQTKVENRDYAVFDKADLRKYLNVSDLGWENDGKKFVGWESESGIKCTPGTEIDFFNLYPEYRNNLKGGSMIIDLYGAWNNQDEEQNEEQDEEQYRISYNPYTEDDVKNKLRTESVVGYINGTVEPQFGTYGTEVNLTSDRYTVKSSNLLQVGWQDAEGKNFYDFGQKYTVTENIELYANWEDTFWYNIYYYDYNEDSEKWQSLDKNGQHPIDVYSSRKPNQYRSFSESEFCKHTNQKFVGWSDSKDSNDPNRNIYYPGEDIDFVALYKKAEYVYNNIRHISLYSVWEDEIPETYTVSYDANGGEGDISANEFKIGENAVLSDGKGFSRTGYTLKGWVLKGANPTKDKVFECGDTVKAFDSDITLYAKWVANKYTVKLVDNGGACATKEITVTYDNLYYDYLNNNDRTLKSFWKTGYKFICWKYGDLIIDSKTIVKETKNHTIEAQWEALQYPVTYKLDDVNNSPSVDGGMYTYDSKMTLASKDDVADKIYKDGFELIGWAVKPNQTEAKYELGESANLTELLKHDKSITLYAVFEEDKVAENSDLKIDNNKWVFDTFNSSVNKITIKGVDLAKSNKVNSVYNLSYAKKGSEDYKVLSKIDNLNNIVPGEYTLKVSYKENGAFWPTEAKANFTVLTPEVYFYVRRNDTWTEMDHVEAGVLSADLFDLSEFKNGNPITIENNRAAVIANDYFAKTSKVIIDLQDNGYEVSFHKIGLFDKTNNDVNHANASKHFHVDFDLSKITDEKVSVYMENWTYGEKAKEPLASQSSTEPATETLKRGNKQDVSFFYTGTLRGEPGTPYSSKEVPQHAGTYTVTATFAANEFYNETTASADFTIYPAIVDVDWKLDNESKNTVEYDGKSHHVYGVVTNECYDGESFYVQSLNADGTDAGSYTSNAWAVTDFWGRITYDYNYNADEKFEWTITQKEVNIVWPKNNNFTYNGYPQGYNMLGAEQIGLTGVLARDNGQVRPTFTKDSVLNATNAGNYYIEAAGLEGGRASNYKLGGFSEEQKWVQTGWYWGQGYYETVKIVPSFDWTIEQLEAKLAWSGDDGLVNGLGTHYRAADRNGLVLYYSEHPYTVTAKVTNIQAHDTVNVTEYSQDWYYWYSEPSNVKTNIGKYNAVATKLDNDNYKLPADAAQKWSIEYYPDLEKVNAVFTEAPNSNGWYNKGVTLTGPQYHIYGIREVNTNGWNWDINKNEETNNGTISYQLNWNEYVSSVKNASYKIDKTAPNGDVYIGYNSILNNKVFKWFFKDSVFVRVNSWDVAGRNNTVSGIAKVEYKLLGDEEFTTYNSFWGIKIDANTKTDVLVKITDNAGNEKVLSNSDDIIVYTDAQADTESVNYVKTSMEEKAVLVKANDNTIKGVQNVTTGEKLTAEDYSVSGNNEIILSGEYLEKLAAKDDSSDSREAEVYKFAVSYNPYGEKFTAYNPYATYYIFWKNEWVNNTDSFGFDAIPTFFKVNVYKANEELTLTIADKTYDGQPIAFEVANESGRDITGNDEESFEIFFAPIDAKGSEEEISEDAWTDVIPKDAGIYRARFVAMEDGSYYRAEAFADFQILRRTVTIDIPDYTKYEDEPDPAFSVSFSNTVPGEGVRGFAWRNNAADNTPGVKSISYRIDGDYPNYDFVYGDMGDLTILARETTAVIIPIVTGGGGGGAVTTVAEEEEITEIEEEEVPEIEVPEVEEVIEEAPVVEIPEEEVPEAVAERCIIHWLALADALLYAMYSIFRALQNKEELSDDAESAKN